MWTKGLNRVAASIRQGGVVAYPTEGVYGLGCDPRNPLAVHRLLRLKQRRLRKGLVLIAADCRQLRPFLAPMPAWLGLELEQSWPGPVTWLLPARAGVAPWLRGNHAALAVRVTDHPLAAALCRASGTPLVSTSANRSGQPPIRADLQVRQKMGEELDDILPGPLGNLAGPTEIRDGLTGQVLRPPA